MRYKRSGFCLVIFLMIATGCHKPAASAAQGPTRHELIESSVQDAMRHAQSIPPTDAAKFGSVSSSFVLTKPLSTADTRFLIDIVNRTKGQPDADYFARNAALCFSAERTYAAGARDDVFNFDVDLVNTYVYKNKSLAMTAPITQIFSRLGDKRGLAVLKAYPRTGGKYYNYLIDKAIASLT